MDLSKIKNIYMIGIKGVGMTMLAQFLTCQGKKITGSDTEEEFMTDQVLKKYKINVLGGFKAKHIKKDYDLIIYSTAYNKENNIEVATALENNLKILTYAESLGTVFNEKYGIAVFGSHGKTTTTAWLGFVLEKANFKPSVMVGARVPQFDGAGLFGDSNFLIIEADEYQNKLQYFQPKAALLNNIDYDHPDFFPTEESYVKVFSDFVEKINKNGFLVVNYDNDLAKEISRKCKGKVISYAIEDKEKDQSEVDFLAYDLNSENFSTNIEPKQYFKVKTKLGELGVFAVSLLGKHNIYNALAVIAACLELEVPLLDIRDFLGKFKSVDRRFDFKGSYNGALIIDDYAHHPTEIKASLETVKNSYPHKNIIVVFHPHTFTRTKFLFNDFLDSFDLADELIVLDIYGSAREIQGGTSSSLLVEKMKEKKNDKIKINHIPTIKNCAEFLKNKISDNDVVLLMGAGDVFRGMDFLKK
jgi:UDP-N-acetylmuramate--alanine ligase